MFIYNLYLLFFILMLYRAPVDTSPVTEGVTLFKHQLLLLLRRFVSVIRLSGVFTAYANIFQSRSQSPRAFWSAPRHGALE